MKKIGRAASATLKKHMTTGSKDAVESEPSDLQASSSRGSVRTLLIVKLNAIPRLVP